jgi:hypothetical protein
MSSVLGDRRQGTAECKLSIKQNNIMGRLTLRILVLLLTISPAPRSHLEKYEFLISFSVSSSTVFQFSFDDSSVPCMDALDDNMKVKLQETQTIIWVK